MRQTAANKAKSLIEKWTHQGSTMGEGKINALIVAKELKSTMISFHGREISDNLSLIDYWEDVIKEINDL